jgi:ribosomal protein S18 acetylase RimI-like enzyme
MTFLDDLNPDLAKEVTPPPRAGLTIFQEAPTRLAEYAQVPIGFTVAERLDEQSLAALGDDASFQPVAVSTPYWKDYDYYPGAHPSAWPRQFDISRWTIFAAYAHARRVGGAVVIVDDPQIDLLRDCPGCALLWDLRVAPDARRQGVGSALLEAAERHASERGARSLRVETQDVNVPACRFYHAHGFRLERIAPGAYAELPNEVQLLWRKALP